MSETPSAPKRLLDLLAGTVGLALISPVLGGIALALKASEPDAPVLFRQRRAGRMGRPFTVYKFRTMRPGDDRQSAGALGYDPSEWGSGVPDDFVYKSAGGSSAAMTRLGRLLRRTSLDELPQLLNIARGEMSLVGPRPEVLPIAERYNARQRRRLQVRPGLTGLAQVRGRSDQTHGQKIRDDLEYVERRSLGLDLQILARTVAVALGRRGSY